MFKLIHKDKTTNARIGKLKTSHGTVETPFFMPVATKACWKHMDANDIKQIGHKTIICNALLLYLKPGLKAINKHGTLHDFMKFKGTIFTDSGGFQTLSDELYIKITDKGILFKSPFDGTEQLVTPELATEYQFKLGSDIAMCFDHMPRCNDTKQDVKKAVERTYKWAKICKKTHDNLDKNNKQLIFGISQGGTFKDLRLKSLKQMIELDFDGIAYGGLAIGEPLDKMHKVIQQTKSIIPEDKPTYLMGVGSPINLLDSIADGIEIFDSVFPTRNARHNTLFTWKGNLIIKKKMFAEDTKPIDENCNCYTCKNFSRSYLHHLLRVQEPLGLRLAQLHNLQFIHDLVKQARTAIKEDRFKNFKDQIIKVYK